MQLVNPCVEMRTRPVRVNARGHIFKDVGRVVLQDTPPPPPGGAEPGLPSPGTNRDTRADTVTVRRSAFGQAVPCSGDGLSQVPPNDGLERQHARYAAMLGRRDRSDDLEGVNLLELAPTRVAEWKEIGGRVVLHRPTPTRGGPAGLLDRLLHALSARRIRLDETGSFVWQRLDGERTVGEVAQALRERFGEAVEPAEERLGRLIRALRREGLVAYPGWDEGKLKDK